MTALALGLLVAGVAMLVAFATVYARWSWRTARRKRERRLEVERQRDELERAERRLRLRVGPA